MSQAPSTEAPAPPAPPAPPDLAQLMHAFNEVTARLSATHEALTAQVLRLQGELQEAKAAVERSKHLAMVGELAAGIAHEIRNPLGSIGLYARMLQQDLADRPPQHATAGKIAGAVTRLNAVVHDVLAFARPMKVRSDELDAREMLEAALDSARGPGPEWEGVQTTLPDAAGPKKALSISGDPNLLHQALINVIRNAAQAMLPDHGPPPAARAIELGCQRKRVRDRDGKSQSMASLWVRDTGPGFPPDVLPRVFQPFFTTRAAGTGLGLAIVHRILDAHGGRVALSNHAGGGAVVELLLPR